MFEDFGYWGHIARAALQGFRPLTRKQFEFRLGVCRLAKQM
jgi:hypothetical protein